MTRLNVLNELTIAERISLHDAMPRHEMNVLTHALKDNPHALALVLLAWDTGARPSELKNLYLRGIDTYNETAIFHYRGKSRLVRWHTSTNDALKQWIKARPNLPHGKVFYNPMTLVPFSRPEIIKYVGILLVNAGIGTPGMSIHSFRASFALRIMATSLPPRAARVLLGLPTSHKDAALYAEDVSAAACLVGYHSPKHAIDFWG